MSDVVAIGHASNQDFLTLKVNIAGDALICARCGLRGLHGPQVTTEGAAGKVSDFVPTGPNIGVALAPNAGEIEQSLRYPDNHKGRLSDDTIRALITHLPTVKTLTPEEIEIVTDELRATLP